MICSIVMKKILLVAIIFIALALLLVKIPKKPVEKKLQKVTIVMPFTPIPQWTTYYTTLKKGYYKDEGLDVNIQYSNKGNAGSVEQLVAGKADLIHTGEESIIMARSKGLDIVSVYQIEPTNFYYIVSEKNKNITKPEDLVGKKVGVITSASGTYTNLQVILALAKVNKNEVEIIQAGSSEQAAFLQGKFDAASFPLGALTIVQEKMPNLNIIKASDYSDIGRGHIASSGQFINNNPELITKFLKATKKGLKYLVDHPEEAVEIYDSINPEAKSQKGTDLNYLKELIKVHRYNTTLPGPDKMQNWQKSQDVLLDTGLITKKTDVSAMFTNKFIPK